MFSVPFNYSRHSAAYIICNNAAVNITTSNDVSQ